MSKIELYFGTPTCDNEWGLIENYADNHSLNIETATITSFRHLIKHLMHKDNESRAYFSDVILIHTHRDLRLPRITTGIYKSNGFVFPKLVIHGDYAIDRDIKKKAFIHDDYIDCIGNEIDLTFTFTYFGFKRVGRINLESDETIYMINEKPHIYYNSKFLPVRKKEPK